ncbi:trans-sialidase, partial [Trypanosoma conorhini]
MSLHWLSSAVLLLFLLVCCGGSGAGANAAKTPEASKEFELFKPGETPGFAAGEEGDNALYESVSSFYGHSLLEMRGVLVALAVGARDDRGSNVGFDLWAKYSAHGADEKLKEDVAWEGKEWRTQLVTKRQGEAIRNRELFGPKALVTESKIYLLLSTVAMTGTYPPLADGWDLVLIVGDVPKPVEGEKPIAWGEPTSVKSALAEQMQKNSWAGLYVAGGARGVAVGDATILFPLAGATHGEAGARACTVVYSDDRGSSWKFPAAPVIAQGCDGATLLEWADKLFMATSGPSPWRRRVFESGDKGKTWNEAAGPFARLLGDAYVLSMGSGASDLISAT